MVSIAMAFLLVVAVFPGEHNPTQAADSPLAGISPTQGRDANIVSLRARENSRLRQQLDIATSSAPGSSSSRQSTNAASAGDDEIFWDGFELCGDGAIDSASEQCDRTDLGGATCNSLGYPGGSLSCDTTCHFDRTACSATCPLTCQTTADCGGGACGPCEGGVCLGAFGGAPTEATR